MKNIIFTLFLFGLSFSAYAQEDEARKVTIIHAGTLLAVAGDEPVANASIIIEDGKITEVVSSFVSTVDDAEVTIVDLSDKFVMSALIDAHIHMAEGGKSVV